MGKGEIFPQCFQKTWLNEVQLIISVSATIENIVGEKKGQIAGGGGEEGR